MLSSMFSRAREALVAPERRDVCSADRYIFPTVNPEVDGEDCDQDCANCTIRYPSRFKIDEERQLYGKVKPVTNHVLIATGKSDWVSKVENEKGSLMEAFKNSSQPRGEVSALRPYCIVQMLTCISRER